jgi:ATP-dependent helicase/nuclease subunit A
MVMDERYIVQDKYENQDWVKKGIVGKTTPWQVLDKFHSVWVSASAGSGKTYLLTARVLNLLLSDVEPEKILCITYTNAGASEMKERVNGKLEEWSRISDDELFEELREMIYSDTKKYSDEFIRSKFEVARTLFYKVLQMSAGMKIQTIHSFCQSVLKKFPVEAGISSNFKVIDERDVEELLEVAYKKVFIAMNGGNYGVSSEEDEYFSDGILAELQDVFKIIVDNVSYASFEGLRNAIIGGRREFKKFFDFCESENPEDVLESVRYQLERVFLSRVDASSKDEVWKKFLDERPFINVLKEFVATVDEYGQKDAGARAFGNVQKMKKMYSFENDVEGRRSQKAYLEEYASAFLTSDFSKVKSKAYLINKKMDTEFPHFIDFLMKEGERVHKLMYDLSAFDDLEYTYAVCCFAYEFIRVFQMEKTLKGAMDFDDMLDLVNKLFSNPSFAGWVLYKLDGGIDHLLVDESQDTSPFQWDIINSLTEEFFGEGKGEFDAKSVFVVGDKKQSIYSFQGADIHHFNMFRKKLRDRVVNRYDAGKWQEISKNVSFRTSPPVLEIVNAVLENSEGKVGVVEAEDLLEKDGSINEKGVAHISVNSDKAGEVVIFPPLSKDAEKVDRKKALEAEWEMPYEVTEKDSPLKKVAIQVADQIDKMIKDKVWLGTKKKYVSASDFMVLVRKRNDFSNLLIRELFKRNIEVAGADQLSLNNYIAFDDMLGLLEFLMVKEDDLLLASVLKSPIFGFDEDDVFKLAYGRENKSIYECLKERYFSGKNVGDMDGLFTPEMKTYNEEYDDRDCNSQKFDRAYLILDKCFEMFEDGVSPYDFFSFILGELMVDIEFYKRLGGEFEDFADEFIKLCLEFENSTYHYLGIVGFLDWVKKSNNNVKRDLSSSSVSGVKIMTCHGSKGLEAPVVIIPAVFADSSGGGGGKVDIYFADTNEEEFSHSSYKIPVLKHPFSFVGANGSMLYSELKELKKEKEGEELNRLLYVAMTRAREKLLVFGFEKNDWYDKMNIAMDSYASVSVEELDDGGKIKRIVALGAEEFSEKVCGGKVEVETVEDAIVEDVDIVREAVDLRVVEGAIELEQEDIFAEEVSEKQAVSILDEDFVNSSELPLKRGIVVHKMMEYVERMKPLDAEKVKKTFDEFLKSYSDLFSDDVREKFLNNVMNLYEDDRFRILFDNDFATSELTLAYEGGLVRLDKLVKRGNSVFIVDFKTDEVPPKSFEDISSKYKVQLRTYKKLVAEVYPDCKVYSALLYLSDLSFYFV